MNLASILESHPDDAPALVRAGDTTTYGALRRQTAAVRGGLCALGVEPGDRVALVLASNWYFVVTYLAVLGAGGVAVPLNPQSPTSELERQLADIDARVAVVGPTAQGAFSTVDRRRVDGLTHVLVPEGVRLDGAAAFDDLLVADPVPVVERAADDLAALLFTSGTAGAPKAAMLTHANLLANLEQLRAVPGVAVRAEDVVLGALPLFHVYGLNAVLGPALAAGARLVLVQRFDPASSLDTIRRHRVSVVAGVPPMFSAWASLPAGEAGPDDFSSVRLLVSGASRLDPAVHAQFRERFGRSIAEGYGLTEASPVVTAPAVSVPDVSAPDGEARPGTIGVPLPGVRVRLVDTGGHDVVVGDPGEIWVQGPNVFAGYWRDAEATARVLTPDGWLRTGDLAVADDDGHLTIVGRLKELVIVSGFNVYPTEVEDVLRQHPGVADCAVVGVPHPHTGEAVKAYVVPRPDRALDEDDLIEFCGRSLARYKCPAKVLFVSELPRALAGAVVRRQLPGQALG